MSSSRFHGNEYVIALILFNWILDPDRVPEAGMAKGIRYVYVGDLADQDGNHTYCH